MIGLTFAFHLPESIIRFPPFQILAIATVCLFLGRGYGYIFYGSPIRALVWDQALFGPVVEGVFGMEWTDFAGSLAVDRTLNGITRTVGLVFWLCAAAALALWRRPGRRRLRYVLYPGSGLLLVHALLDTKEHFFHIAQFFEHGVQVATPLLLVYATGGQGDGRQLRLLRYIRLAVAVTFVAHGLYAVGAYPVPAKFVNMTIGILGCSEPAARTFLLAAGWLDFVAAACLFVPRWQRPGLIYMVLWGFLTALARVVYGFSWGFPLESLHGYLYQTVFRLPHGLVPLAGLLLSGLVFRAGPQVQRRG